VRIFKTYGADAIRVISENPYRLARDIRGIGFKSADLIAEKLGIEKTAMIRARAGIGYTLTEAMDEGHCGLPLAQLVPMAVTLLDVPTEIIESALDLELRDGEVIADTVDGERCIFLAGLHRAERAIAARIKALSSDALTWPAIDADKAIPWVEGKAGVTLAESQREAGHCDRRSSSSPVVPVSARPRWSTPRRATARSTPSRGISPRTTSPFSSSICTSRRRSRRRGFKLDWPAPPSDGSSISMISPNASVGTTRSWRT
jgi:exodeoxyribonuclease V alpha subunit